MPAVPTDAEIRAPNATDGTVTISSDNLVPVLATSSASVHMSDVTISEVDGSASAEESPQHESAPNTPMSTLGRVFQRMASSDAVDSTITDTRSASVNTVAVGEISND
jgi:hypothetical protein